jgi:hypothetical protein
MDSDHGEGGRVIPFPEPRNIVRSNIDRRPAFKNPLLMACYASGELLCLVAVVAPSEDEGDPVDAA